MDKDFYKILEINRDADLSIIKKAYRRLALLYHPDKNKHPKAQAKFVTITEAYEILKDPIKKKLYDANFETSYKTTTATTESYYTHREKWSKDAEQKAREYASMDYEDFINRVFGEIKVVAKSGLSIFLVIFCVFGAITGFSLMSISPFLGIFTIILWGGLGFLLFNRTKENYKKDRNKMLNNKK